MTSTFYMIMYADPDHHVYNESKKHKPSNQLFNAIKQRISFLDKKLIVSTSVQADPDKFFTTIIPHITLVNFEFNSIYYDIVNNLLSSNETEKFIYDKYYKFKQYLDSNNIKFTHEQMEYEILNNKFFCKIYKPKIKNKNLIKKEKDDLNIKLLNFKCDVIKYFIKKIEKETIIFQKNESTLFTTYQYNEWTFNHYKEIKFHFSILSIFNLSNLYNEETSKHDKTEIFDLKKYILNDQIKKAKKLFLYLTRPTDKKKPVPYPNNLIFEDTLSISIKKKEKGTKPNSIFYPKFYKLENYFILRGKIYFLIKI